MAKIIQMRDEGIEAYPITKPEAVIDEDGKTILDIIQEMQERINQLEKQLNA